MKNSRLINAVDVWAAGGPHRVVTGGLPPIKGRTMQDKQDYVRKHLSGLPAILTTAEDDPKAMVAALLTEPCHADADIGVIWMGCGEFMNMCGTGTFAIGTVLGEMGMVDTSTGRTNLILEIPAGLQHVQINMPENKVNRVAVRTSAAYYHGDYHIRVADFGELTIELAYGINCLEPLINCERLGIPLVPENAQKLAQLGEQIRKTILESGQVDVRQQTGVQLSFYQDRPAGSDADFRSMAIVGQAEVDATPSGTSTCAQLAMRFAKKMIRVGDELKVESITGAVLSGRVVEQTNFQDHQAVIPEISGNGRITRLQQIIG